MKKTNTSVLVFFYAFLLVRFSFWLALLPYEGTPLNFDNLISYLTGTFLD